MTRGDKSIQAEGHVQEGKKARRTWSLTQRLEGGHGQEHGLIRDRSLS